MAEGEAEFNPLSDPEEARVLFAALDSYRQYRRAAHFNITHLRRQSFYSLPSKHIDLLSSPPFDLPKHFNSVDDAIDSNADIAEAILNIGLPFFDLAPNDESWRDKATPTDLDKARATIRQFYRDWSREGLPERHASFAPIFKALEKYLACAVSERHRHRILVPGAGLGRLVFELCAAGYTVEGNEISYHQVLASNYILNYTEQAAQHKLYPWALSFSNHASSSDQLQSVEIPDVHPASVLETTVDDSDVHYSERMAMTSGDFCVMYKQPEYANAFDSVTTCFFIDTAKNLINYIETVRSCLGVDGFWINTGPLLWHFESRPMADRGERLHHNATSIKGAALAANDGIGEPGSFELSNEQVIALVQSLGFEVLEHTSASPTGYIQDPASMLQNVYRPSFWVARKKSDAQ